MGKLFTPQPIASGFNTNNSLNANFEAIEEALDKCLSRTGETPNAMSTDVDMGGKNLLNTGTLFVDAIFNRSGDFLGGAAWGHVSGDITDQTDLVNLIGGVSTTWGSIQGDISNQTDLQNLVDNSTTTWGNLQGTLTDQEDLVQYISNNSGGGGGFTTMIRLDPSDTSWVVPAGVTSVKYTVTGGGGGGGNDVDPGDFGEWSKFNGVIGAGGGYGESAAAGYNDPSDGGYASGGDLNIDGGPGFPGIDNPTRCPGGTSYWGSSTNGGGYSEACGSGGIGALGGSGGGAGGTAIGYAVVVPGTTMVIEVGAGGDGGGWPAGSGRDGMILLEY